MNSKKDKTNSSLESKINNNLVNVDLILVELLHITITKKLQYNMHTFTILALIPNIDASTIH
jgi:hypothetical protein